MAAIKVSKLDLKFVENNYPELLVAINKIDKDKCLTELVRQQIAWLAVECIRKCNVDPLYIFEEEADLIYDSLKHNYE